MSKVLIADDDEAIGTLLSTLLTEEGYQVTLTHDGAEALEALKREGGWVILLDLMMPKIDGYEVLRQLQRDSALLDGNKVIVMSANWRLASDRLNSLSQVVADVLPKPFELQHVLTLVKRLSSAAN
jgi:CheY-like chemotaxis protein